MVAYIVTGFVISGLLRHFNLKTAKIRKTPREYQLWPYILKILILLYAPTYSVFIHAKNKKILPWGKKP